MNERKQNFFSQTAETIKAQSDRLTVPAGTPFWWKAISSQDFAQRAHYYSKNKRVHFTRLGVSKEIRRALAIDAKRHASQGDAPLSIDRHGLFEALDNKLGALLSYASPHPPQAVVHRLAEDAFLNTEGLIFSDATPRVKPGDYLEVQFAMSASPAVATHGYYQVVGVEAQSKNDKRFNVICRIATATAPMMEEEPKPAMVPPPPEPPPEPVVTQALSDAERKQSESYRVNDEVPFRWRLVRNHELEKIKRYFGNYGSFPALRQDEQYTEVSDTWDSHHALLKNQQFNALDALHWMQERISLLYRRANHPQEMDLYLDLLSQTNDLAELLSQKGRAGSVPLKLLGLTKEKLELTFLRDMALFANQPRKSQEAAGELAKLEGQLRGIMADLTLEDQKSGNQVHYLSEAFDQLDLSDCDYACPEEEPDKLILPHAVNLSSAGIAFRTRRKGLTQGSFVEIYMELSQDGKHWQPVHLFGKLVLMKGPDANGQFRLATMILMIPPAHKEILVQHVVRKHREG
uniref:PilZ domain-containing protein n=1 Tax=Magnetococcus massalia (strain MO-1) TaxID=451514 RepID=A0A1S7LEV5_MAGMO|nr:conserved protein of unknown function [Candidatus Magnetococcus massalia]